MSSGRSTILFRDPLKLLPYQTGLLAPQLTEGAAEGQNPMSTPQEAVVLGEPIPIIFCRRVDGIGGVFVSPRATEGRYENDAITNQLTVNLQLVLSQGDLPTLQLTDLYQRNCRVGSWIQNYDARAGTWTPGNFIVAVAGKDLWDCPQYCGTSGHYTDMTTLSYTNTHPDGDDSWDKQVHAFVRNGIQVTRILDNTLGSSNNVADLTKYLITQSSRVPSLLIDNTALAVAANFTNVNGFFYNGEFKESANLEDWLQEISSSFLLRVSDNKGKKGFRPRLPINNDYTIKTTKISWVFTFREEHVMPDGFEIEYIPLSERKPICALILWRQQPDSEVGIIRTSEVRFTGEATEGPFEQYDLSQFCTAENHAIKVGMYYVARRKYISHTIRLRVKPDSFNDILTLGDIVRVQLARETDEGNLEFHDYLYEVERISKLISGVVELDLVHFPVDAQGRSLVALAVSEAVGEGYVAPSGRNDFSCNVNTSTDPIPKSGTNIIGLPTSGDVGYGGTPVPEEPPGEDEPNPPDPYTQPLAPGLSGSVQNPAVGDTVTAPVVCPGQITRWYLVPVDDPTLPIIPLSLFDVSIVYTEDMIGYRLEATGECPGGPEEPLGQTEPVEPDFTQYTQWRWVGVTGSSAATSNVITTNWANLGDVGPRVNGIYNTNCAGPLYSDDWAGPVGESPPWTASVSVTNVTDNPNPGFGTLGCGSSIKYPPIGAFTIAIGFGISGGETAFISGAWQLKKPNGDITDWKGRPRLE